MLNSNECKPQKHSSFLTAFAVASVYFGAVVGPDMVGGSTSIVYFTPYGKYGLIPILIVTGVIGLIMGMGSIIPRLCGVYEYNAYAKILYGRFYRFLGPILDIYIVFAMILGGSVVVSVGGEFFSTVLGCPMLVGYIAISVLSALLVLWGEGLVKATSSIMAVLMTTFFVIICSVIIFQNTDAVQRVYTSEQSFEGVKSLSFAIIPAIALGMSNAPNGVTMSAVEQKVQMKRESFLIGFLCFAMTALSYLLSTTSTLVFCPEILGESVPILTIIREHMGTGYGWMRPIYYVLMFLALLSSGAPQFHALAARFQKIYPQKGLLKMLPVRNLITGVVYFTVCILIANFGVIALISKGYAVLGYLGMAITVIPICIIAPIRIKLGKIPVGEAARTE